MKCAVLLTLVLSQTLFAQGEPTAKPKTVEVKTIVEVTRGYPIKGTAAQIGAYTQEKLTSLRGRVLRGEAIVESVASSQHKDGTSYQVFARIDDEKTKSTIQFEIATDSAKAVSYSKGSSTKFEGEITDTSISGTINPQSRIVVKNAKLK